MIQLEDGTAAYIHQVMVQKGEGTASLSCVMEGGPAAPAEGPLPGTTLQRKAGIALVTEPLSFEDGQPVQLEDGSVAYIHRTPKGGVTASPTYLPVWVSQGQRFLSLGGWASEVGRVGLNGSSGFCTTTESWGFK